MKQEDKELLFKDLCARLPYGVKVRNVRNNFDISYFDNNFKEINILIEECNIKPYLRPMSLMTKKECTQLSVLLPRYFTVLPDCLYCTEHVNSGIINPEVLDTIIDFYNSNHLDWRGLIPKGLAIEAPKGMYDIK